MKVAAWSMYLDLNKLSLIIPEINKVRIKHFQKLVYKEMESTQVENVLVEKKTNVKKKLKVCGQ